ncbi:hypothetical protein GCM10023086_01140 [Streptomyces venetus]|uniref:Uncharacterized protein n=2 Tax=Streptomyces venetus TaxID=1701086 RepID=A0ABP8F0N8_9ACTN
MARRDFSLRRVESGAGLAGWVDFWAAMARIYQVDKTVRLADSERHARDEPSRREGRSGKEPEMTRGGAGNMLGVGGSRRNLGREELRGGGRGGRIGGGLDPQAQKRELLRKLQEKRQQQERQEGRTTDRSS